MELGVRLSEPLHDEVPRDSVCGSLPLPREEKGDFNELLRQFVDKLSTRHEAEVAILRKRVRELEGIEGISTPKTSCSKDNANNSALEVDWPSTVPARDLFQGITEYKSHRGFSTPTPPTNHSFHRKRLSSGSLFSYDSSTQVRCGCIPLWCMDPNSKFLRGVEMLGIVFCIFDCIISPYVWAWRRTVRGAVLAFSILNSLYWTLKMPLDSVRGMYRYGEQVVSFRDVLRSYVSTYFLPDFLLCALSWTNVAMDCLALSDGQDIFAVTDVTRILVFLRLARLWRLIGQANQLMLTLSDQLRFFIRVIQVICVTLVVVHFISCLWFFVGMYADSDTGKRWLHTAPFAADPGNTFLDFGAMSQYCASFHWSVAQITLNASDAFATNSAERILTILLQIVGLTFSSTVVAVFSAQSVSFLVAKEQKEASTAKLRVFLKQNAFEKSLAVSVFSQAVERMSQEEPIREADVSALDLVSSRLRAELKYQLRVPILITHPLLHMWCVTDIHALHALCEVVLVAFYSTSDDVFRSGVKAEQAYMVSSGALCYNQTPETSFVEEKVSIGITKDAIVAEAALWSQWIHVGSLVATTSCQLLLVVAEGLLKVMRSYPSVGHMTSCYGSNYHSRLVSAMPPWAPYPTDLQVAFTEAHDLLSSDVGLSLIKQANLTAAQADLLETEIEAGACAVRAGPDGSLERTCGIVTLRVVDGKQRTLMHLGRTQNGEVVNTLVNFPGGKRSKDETPKDTLTRLLGGRLYFLSHVGFSLHKRDYYTKDSVTYGLPTTYFCTVYIAELLEDVVEELTWPEITALNTHILSSRSVYAFSRNQETEYYGFVSEEETSYLRTDGGQRQLRDCLLDLAPHAVTLSVAYRCV